jgi:hypothetical protein
MISQYFTPGRLVNLLFLKFNQFIRELCVTGLSGCPNPRCVIVIETHEHKGDLRTVADARGFRITDSRRVAPVCSKVLDRRNDRETESLARALRAFQPALSLAVGARRLFREERPYDALLVLVLDTREQLCPQLGNCFWFIERQLLIHLAALKVTGLAAGLEYRSDVRGEGGPFRQRRCGGLIVRSDLLRT